MHIPTDILWITWAIIGFFSILIIMELFNGSIGAKIVALCFALYLIATILWYTTSLTEFDSRPMQTNIVGIVETMELKNKTKISIVKTDAEIINVTAKYNTLLPDGSTYYILSQSNNIVNGLRFNTITIHEWKK